MTTPIRARAALALACCSLLLAAAHAAPVTYKIDPAHTFPSFEADHMGISVWRGKFDRNEGQVTLDRVAAAGTVHIVVDVNSVNFGLPALDKVARTEELFDTAKYPQAVYDGKLDGFVDGVPTRAAGTLTLHGVTQPLTLEIRKFKCIPHPMFKREDCGADVYATLDRSAFGMDAGKAYGFSMDVALRIQVEALADK
jgi:polyisoprenoid-binding protein YceI